VAGHVQEQVDTGVDAMDHSAPWSGQGFISREMYGDLIVPVQKILVDVCRANGVSSHCHTCGAIDDRLEQIIAVGFDGIECLDPPPLGNVELDDAVRRIGDRAYIKGNIDPVNVLMNGTREEVTEDVKRRLEVGMGAGGFILSTACAIAPRTPPENVMLLRELAEEYGRY
jgi:uroporphyrinogen decarboxylase